MIDYDPREADAPALAAAFDSGLPFRHVVIDDFFDAPSARAVSAGFPPLAIGERSLARALAARVHDGRIERAPHVVQAAFGELCSERFVRFLERLTGIADLVPDKQFVGAGMHQGGNGSALPVHADHNTHPDDSALYRRVNVLVYLNERWEPEWDGRLELWDSDLEACRKRVEPAFNRCVILEVHDRAFHGYRRLRLPRGMTRKALVCYYYSKEPGRDQAAAPHPTIFGFPQDVTPLERFQAVAKRFVLQRLRSRFARFRRPRSTEK